MKSLVLRFCCSKKICRESESDGDAPRETPTKANSNLPSHGRGLLPIYYFPFPFLALLLHEIPALPSPFSSISAGEALGMESAAAAAGPGEGHIKGILTHSGRYVRYNVHGNLFEVTAKYVPPIRPIGRGANGIVWWVQKFTPLFIPHSPLFFIPLVWLFLLCAWIGILRRVKSE